MYHLFDGDFHEGGGVVWGIPSNIAGEVLLQFGHAFFYQRGGGGGVAAVGQHHGHAHGGFAVEAGTGGVVFRAQLDFGHVFQINVRAAGGGAQDDVAELLRRAQLPLRRDGGRDGLPGLGRQGADGAGGNLRVLRRNGRRHVQEREVVVLQLFRIDPHAHGALRAKQAHVAHAVDALQLGHNVALRVVQQLFGRFGFRLQEHHHQEVGTRFGNDNPVLLHGSGQERGYFR